MPTVEELMQMVQVLQARSQAPQTGPVTANPMMARQFARQRENVTPASSVMDPRWDAQQTNQRQADYFLLGSDVATAPFALPKGAATAGAKYAGRTLADALEGHMQRSGMMPQIMAGRGARTANLAKLEEAKQMQARGIPDEQIWKETGWTAGFPDKQWRFEIPDNAAKFRMDFNSAAPTKSNNYAPRVDMPLGGAFSHDELYKAYPDLLTKERMSVAKRPEWMKGSGNSGEYKPGLITVNNETQRGAKSTAVHELQHAVQGREGFASGGMAEQLFSDAYRDLQKMHPYMSNTQLSSLSSKRAFEMYRSLAGETEARLAQARMNMTPAQRAASYPPSMFDVPIDQQIIRK